MRFIDHIESILNQESLDLDQVSRIVSAIQAAAGGQTVYIHAEKQTIDFDGHDVNEIAKKNGVSRATIYRKLRVRSSGIKK